MTSGSDGLRFSHLPTRAAPWPTGSHSVAPVGRAPVVQPSRPSEAGGKEVELDAPAGPRSPQ